MSYSEIIGSLPTELRVPIARLVDALKEDFAVKKADFDELKAIVRDLADAQKRTEHQVELLAGAQKRTEDELVLFRRTFMAQVGGLGARWGLQTEEAFRQGMRAILQEVGFTAERFLESDATGHVFGYPEQIELDVVVKNGRVLVVEIKSSLDRANVYIFARKVEFYVQHTGRQVNRRLIISPYADNRAKEVGLQLGIEICTDITTLQ